MNKQYFRRLHWFIRFCLAGVALVILWSVVAFLIPRLLPRAFVVNSSRWGLIIRDETWSGDIKITGDVWALPGTTVTILPGTKVTVATSGDQFNFDWLPWHLQSGLNIGPDKFGVLNGELFWDERQKIQIHFAKLYALGTPEHPIFIQSMAARPGSPYDFNILSLEQGIVGHTKLSNYRKLEVGNDVTIRDSEFKNVVECAICTEYNNPSILNNTFEEAVREYIWVLGGSPKINDNLFTASAPKGIVIDPQTVGAPIIYHNNFEMPGRVAVELLSGSEKDGGVLSLNDFAGSSVIRIPCDSQVKILQNQIRGLIELARSGNCVGSLTLGPNYWSSEDKKAILREKIIGQESQFKILIPSVLNSSPSGVGKRSF